MGRAHREGGGARSLRRFAARLFRRLPEPVQWRVQRLLAPAYMVGVVGLVADGHGRVLLCRHTYRTTPWGLPSGWLVPGETPAACIAREVLEETGLVVEPVALWRVETDARRPRLDVYLRCRYVAGTFRPSPEVDAVRWLAPGQPYPTGTHRATVRVLEAYWAGE